jgi:hypothetical protein
MGEHEITTIIIGKLQVNHQEQGNTNTECSNRGRKVCKESTHHQLEAHILWSNREINDRNHSSRNIRSTEGQHGTMMDEATYTMHMGHSPIIMDQQEQHLI